MRFFIRLAVLATMTFATAAFAAEGPIVLQAAHQTVLVDDFAAWLKDPDKTLTIDEAYARRAEFQKPQNGTLNFGLSTAAYWLRFEVENPSPLPRQWVFEASDTVMDYVEIHVPRPNGGWERKIAGDRVLPEAKELDPRKPSFLFTAPPHARQEVFVRYRIEPVGALNLTAHIHSPDQYEAGVRTESYFYGFFYGALAIMFLYNFFIWLSVRDASYLYYVTYQLVVGLFWLGMNGFGITYVWPEFQELGRHITVPLVGLSLVTANLFMQTFLRTRERHPRFHRFSHLIYALATANILLWALGLPMYAIPIAYFSTLTVLVFLFGGALSIHSGYRPARYYTLAWAMFIGGTCVYALKDIGLLPYNVFTNWSAQGGGLLEMALLSFALADRIKTLNDEKTAAQRETQEALARAKGELEREVAERTNELRQQKERAEQATQLKDNYVTLVSHDLRSPLASVLSMVRFLKTDINKPSVAETVPALLGKAHLSLEAMLHMIDQLLDISRLQSGAHELRLRYVAVHGLADAKIGLLSQMAADKNITIHNALPVDMRIVGDLHLIGEVIANLLSNAVKFTSAGGHVRLFAPSEIAAVIAVEDDGMGIAPALIPRLFTHAIKSMSHGTAGEKGSGLGLPYSMDIMRVHGGNITVEQKPSGGTIIFLSFPRTVRTVMVVDDQEIYRRIVRQMLSRFTSITIVEANDGRDALEQMGGHLPELVISDIQMPNMDGMELLASLREKTNGQHIPVLLMSAHFSSEGEFDAAKREKAEKLGVANFIAKPLIEADVLALVRKLLLVSE